MSTQWLKVAPPYFHELWAGTKTFEVRRNDRGFQTGDTLILREYGTHRGRMPCEPCDHSLGIGCKGCHKRDTEEHYSGREITRTVAYLYAGDPRFAGIEPGYVVLGLKK